jgi:hypothetical protein
LFKGADEENLVGQHRSSWSGNGGKFCFTPGTQLLIRFQIRILFVFRRENVLSLAKMDYFLHNYSLVV